MTLPSGRGGMMHPDLAYWLAVARVPWIGAKRLALLEVHFESLTALERSDATAFTWHDPENPSRLREI
jgi:hypothetical protein